MGATKRTLANLCAAVLALGVAAPGLGQDPTADPALIDDLVADLHSDNEYVRRLARQTLVKLEGENVARRVSELLDDTTAFVRVEAATVLELMGDRAVVAVPALRRAVNDPAPEVRQAALSALFVIRPDEPLPSSSLVEMLKSGEMQRIDLALTVIRRLGTTAADAAPDLVRLLREQLDGGDDVARCAKIANALGSTGVTSADAVKSLTGYLVFRGRTIKNGAGPDLSALRAAAPAILGHVALHGVAPDAQGPWIAELAQLAGARPGDPIVPLARSGDAAVKQRAIELLYAMGPNAIAALDALIDALDDPRAGVRRAAADALGAIGTGARPAVPALVGLLEDRGRRTRLWAARALGSICEAQDLLGAKARAARANTLREDEGEWRAISLGLRWLAKHQDEDGKWDCDDFMKHDPGNDKCDGAGGQLYDVGVTGLAMLAFLGAGYTDSGSSEEHAHRDCVRMGLRYLVQSQTEDGVFGSRATHSFIYNHAIATLALCDAYWMTGNPLYGRPAQEALNFIAMARNPYAAWRYEPRGGENDTSVTGWCVMALKSGELAGLEVDPDAFRGARKWTERMTSPESGQVGYNFPGGVPARPEGKQDRFPPKKSQAMTAAGIVIRTLTGEDPGASSTISKGAGLCLTLPPKWNPDDGSIDMYYWYYASQAMFRCGGRAWSKWHPAMKRAALSSQCKGTRSQLGSWPPIGVWGDDGGRVYSTAMMILCLEAPARAAHISPRQPQRGPEIERARAALGAAREDDDPMLAKAAKRALRRLDG